MRLYTVCVRGRPVLVKSTDVEPPMPDSLTTNAELMKAHRAQRALMEQTTNDKTRHIGAVREIDEALDTWLGTDLMVQSLWNGDWSDVQIREATAEEAGRWH